MRAFLFLALTLSHLSAQAGFVGAFGANGESGTFNGFDLGSDNGTEIVELDAWLGIAGQDLNGPFFGEAARLSLDPLPLGLDFTFGALFGASDVTLTYRFENNTGAAIDDLAFLSFVDADIDPFENTSFNENATASGVLAANQNFEADSVFFGDLFDNLDSGFLDGTNAVGIGFEEDVGLALSFGVALLDLGQIFETSIRLSDDGSRIGTFDLCQSDPDSGLTNALCVSGTSQVLAPPGVATPVPAPPSWVLLLTAIGLLRRLV